MEQAFVLTVSFKSPSARPSARQFEALFERLDEASMRAVVIGQLGYGPQDIARQVLGLSSDPRWLREARADARRALVAEPELGRLLTFEFASPPKGQLLVRGRNRALATLASIAVVFGAATYALDAVDDTVRSATGLLHDGTKLLREAERFVEEANTLGKFDPHAARSDKILRGGRGEPSVGISQLRVRPHEGH